MIIRQRQRGCGQSVPVSHANTDPQRDSIFTKAASDVLDHATNEIGIASPSPNTLIA